MARGALVLGVGAAEGLGGALCRRIAREGLAVFAVGRTQAKLDAVAARSAPRAAARTPSPPT
jgi:short-subunit dehydrogenase